MKYAVDFKVVAVSSNTNSFGLHEVVMVAKDGLAYKGYASYLNVPKKDDIISIKFIKKGDGSLSDKLDFVGRFEVPTRIEDAPLDVRNKIWGDDNTLSFDNFKTELKELMKKYDASIGCDIDGDTHGISTTMVVEIGKKDHILGYSSYIDWSDLK